jgi:hypothetical protein
VRSSAFQGALLRQLWRVMENPLATASLRLNCSPMKPMTSAARLPFAIVFVAVTLSVASGAGQAPSRVWPVGPLTKGEQVMGFVVSI